MASSVVSEGMRALLDAHRKAHESVLRLQAQIEEEEAAYLEETPHGNIIRGWDGFIDAKQPRKNAGSFVKDAATKKTKPYSDAEHLFSGCCAYAALAAEPALDLVDPTAAAAVAAADEAAALGKRKLSASTSGGAVAAVSGGSGGGSKLQRASSLSERKASIGSATGGAAAGKASKLKKRRLASQDSQNELETASPALETGGGGGADKDFLDVF